MIPWAVRLVVESSRLDLEVRLLGAVDVAGAGPTVPIGSAKQRAVLAAVALTPGEIVSTDGLIDALWSGEIPETAQGTLRSLVYRLRRALSDAAGGGSAEFLRARGTGYLLDLPPEAVDAARFERLAKEAREALGRGDPEQAAGALEAGLALWRGPALGDLSGWPFFSAAARHLDEARLDMIEHLAEAELALGRPERSLVLLEPHLAVNPLREHAWGQLILALYRLGRQADALRAYQRVRKTLAEELGIEPNPALRDLEAAILQQRPELLSARAGAAPLKATAPLLGDIEAFLFTDIEASTRRWEGDQEAMAVELARHDKLLGETFGQWGGRVFGHTGDGLCVAFPTAATAIRAAVAGQGRLAGERWERDEPLRVRMAVHAGAAECRAGNYFGPTLNRTARLLATAWGGQIVCSAVAADLAADQLPDQVTLLDLGDHRLADLARPERVFQVGHPTLTGDFPPLRGAGALRHNLPAALTSFVGRGRELDEITGLLEHCRLVTLAGPGGAGKTRLALEAANLVVERFPDGVWLVELAPVPDAAAVSHALATAVGLDRGALAASGRPFLEALCDQLRHRRVLVVLDNCEHVVEAASVLAHTVLALCPDVVLLATSREVLAVPGETIVRVGPLSLPPPGSGDGAGLKAFDAVTLFCERARESVAGFALTPANAPAVIRICRRLDGSPLALELAASRLRLLSAHQLADRLDDRFDLLADGARTVDPRHQTLQAAIDWSYELLPDTERAVLRRLSVFPADFSLEAAEAVTGAGDVVGLLGRLVDKSLVVASLTEDGLAVRYRLLETVRQYAAEKLDGTGEIVDVQRRHRDFFCAADGWDAELMYDRRLRWAEAEADNVRAALRWSLDRGDREASLRLVSQHFLYWFLIGASDVIEPIERAIALPGPAAAPLLWAHFALAFLLLAVRGDEFADRFEPLMREALAIAEREQDANGAAWARVCLAQAAAARGRFDECEALLSETEALYPHRPAEVRAWGHLLLAQTALDRSELDQAGEQARKALRLTEQTSNFAQAQGSALLALVEASAGRVALGRRHAEVAVVSARQTPGRRTLVMALTRAAEAALVSGEPETAGPHLDELLGTLRELGSQTWAAEALELTAVVIGPNRPEAAATLLGAAVSLRGLLREEEGVLAVLSERLAACRHDVAARLGEAEASDRECLGRSMHLAEVLAYARAELQAAL